MQIPRFCDHPLLEPVGACRQCLVDIATPGPDGSMRPMPKPQASCTITVSEGMQVKTQLTSPVADKAQHGVMELLLINHPLDCPVCDKGGECPLQNQAMSNGRPSSRFQDVKRTYPKPINISSQVLLDRERCVLCARCTRFSDQIAGDPFIALVERGALQQVGIYEDQPFESYFSGNTVQICPVGALTGAAYRFRSRPFDLVSTPSVCEHCASGCSIRTDHRRGAVLRRMALNDPAVNEEWNCDKGRWAFQYATLPDRLEVPAGARRGRPAARCRVARGPRRRRRRAAQRPRAGVLVGGRVSVEDAYAYGKFARIALHTNDVDFRARPHSAEEVEFLAEHVVATGPDGGRSRTPTSSRPRPCSSSASSPRTSRRWSSCGCARPCGPSAPRSTPSRRSPPAASRSCRAGSSRRPRAARPASSPTSRRARPATPRSRPCATAASSSSASAWPPCRVPWRPRSVWPPRPVPGSPGSPVGPVSAARWRPAPSAPCCPVAARPQPAGPHRGRRGLGGRRPARRAGPRHRRHHRGGLLGRHRRPRHRRRRPADLSHPGVEEALAKTFVVSLEMRESAVTEVADVVLPVAPQAEKVGAYVDWEGRVRPFKAALDSNAMSDHRVLDMLAAEIGFFLETRTQEQVHDEFARLGRGPATAGSATGPTAPPTPPAPTSTAGSSSRRGRPCSTPAGCRTASRSSPAPLPAQSPSCPSPTPSGSSVGRRRPRHRVQRARLGHRAGRRHRPDGRGRRLAPDQLGRLRRARRPARRGGRLVDVTRAAGSSRRPAPDSRGLSSPRPPSATRPR